MSNSVKIQPVAIVLPVKGEGKKVNTNILIRVGPNLVANGILGGEYNETQALREFKNKNPKLKVREGWEDVAVVLRRL